MAKAELFGMRLLGPLIRFMGTFPVQRDSADREALRIAVELARGGEVVGMFPEGQIGDDTKLGKLMEGAALIARMSGVPVICCGLRGTERIIPYGKILPRPAFRLVRATWWEPRLFGPHATTDEIMDWARAEMIALGGYEPD
jgi:1-acyl-sn-glycerol-3-phosphate acyltransferase